MAVGCIPQRRDVVAVQRRATATAERVDLRKRHKSAIDMASASGSFTTGLVEALSSQSSASRMRRMKYRSTNTQTNYSGNGLPPRHIFSRHPKRKLHEVHYARHVVIASGRLVPSSFGM